MELNKEEHIFSFYGFNKHFTRDTLKTIFRNHLFQHVHHIILQHISNYHSCFSPISKQFVAVFFYIFPNPCSIKKRFLIPIKITIFHVSSREKNMKKGLIRSPWKSCIYTISKYPSMGTFYFRTSCTLTDRYRDKCSFLNSCVHAILMWWTT